MPKYGIDFDKVDAKSRLRDTAAGREAAAEEPTGLPKSTKARRSAAPTSTPKSTRGRSAKTTEAPASTVTTTESTDDDTDGVTREDDAGSGDGTIRDDDAEDGGADADDLLEDDA